MKYFKAGLMEHVDSINSGWIYSRIIMVSAPDYMNWSAVNTNWVDWDMKVVWVQS